MTIRVYVENDSEDKDIIVFQQEFQFRVKPKTRGEFYVWKDSQLVIYEEEKGYE